MFLCWDGTGNWDAFPLVAPAIYRKHAEATLWSALDRSYAFPAYVRTTPLGASERRAFRRDRNTFLSSLLDRRKKEGKPKSRAGRNKVRKREIEREERARER